MLTLRCGFHTRYTANRTPKRDCGACKLLYVLVNQRHRSTDELLKEVGFPGAETTSKDEGWQDPLTCLETGKKSSLTVKCQHHGYKATRKPGWSCLSCWLLYVLKYQGHKDGERRLGPFNPYHYVIDHVDLREASANLLVVG